MLRGMIEENIHFEFSLAPELGVIEADSVQLEQVLLNLVVNARDAMRGGGHLRISTDNESISRQDALCKPPLHPGRFVSLRVRDTGCGMDEEVSKKVFDPFFTTKEDTGGSGLGLSTAYGIVKQSGGFIFLDSTPGAGSEFKVMFPRSDDLPQPERDAPAPAEAQASGEETLLVVEDNDLIRSMTVQILEASGFHVLLAADGDAALTLAEEEGGRIDLLFTDLVMPGLNGVDLARRIRRHHPEIKLLFTSGYPGDTLDRQGLSALPGQLLPKPFTATSLLAAIRLVLDGRES